MIIEVGYYNFENSIPRKYQFNQLFLKNQLPIGRLLITGLITGSKINNQPTLPVNKYCT